MSVIQITTLKIHDADLVKMSDSLLDRIGKLTVDAVKRKRNELVCDRDGHDWEMRWGTGRICSRCFLVEGEMPT